MSAVVAKTAMGFCSCGVLIEPGQIIAMVNGEAIHVDCKPKQPRPTAGSTSQSPGLLFDDMELKSIENARQTVGASRVVFDGATVLGIDTPRLAGQLARVYSLMSDGRYRTLEQIASAVDCLETSASSRLRDFRKARFGGHTVVSRQLAGSPGVYEYRLISREGNERDGQRSAA